MKKIIKNLFRKININIEKINPELRNSISFDEIYKNKFNTYPIIFDVGANQGQSIQRFKNIFPNCIIHSFEPIISEYGFLKNKYDDDKNVFINNLALGDKNEKKIFNIAAKTGTSSFNDINQNTKWIKARSKEYKTSEQEFIQTKSMVNIVTIDNYCEKNFIDKIDILKIDTQGYEDKVLKGSINMLNKNLIDAVELEIMFDNVYEKYLSFSDVEQYLLPRNFRLCALKTINENLFEGLSFSADAIYLNKSRFDLL